MTASYLPAPCAFYADIASTKNNGRPFATVRLVTDDANHPCVDVIKSVSANVITEPAKSVQDDFETLMRAQNIALSPSSTFGLAAVFISPTDNMNVHLPVYKGRDIGSMEASFNPQRLQQLCDIGRGSTIYEIPV